MPMRASISGVGLRGFTLCGLITFSSVFSLTCSSFLGVGALHPQVAGIVIRLIIFIYIYLLYKYRDPATAGSAHINVKK